MRRFSSAGTMFVIAMAFGGKLLAQPVPESPKAPVCSVPDVPSRVVQFGTVYTPQIAYQQGIIGTVAVRVNLDSASHVIGTPVVQKSPSSVLNKAAIDAAKTSAFLTRIANCVPVADSYTLLVQFSDKLRVPATLGTSLPNSQ